MRLTNQFQGQTVKRQGYRREGHTVSAKPGGHTACCFRFHLSHCASFRFNNNWTAKNRPQSFDAAAAACV